MISVDRYNTMAQENDKLRESLRRMTKERDDLLVDSRELLQEALNRAQYEYEAARYVMDTKIDPIYGEVSVHIAAHNLDVTEKRLMKLTNPTEYVRIIGNLEAVMTASRV